MKKKNLILDSVDLLLFSYREQILNGEVNEVSPNGLWITAACGKKIFLSRTELEMMRDLVANFF